MKNEDLKLILVDSILQNKEVGFSDAVSEATRIVRLVKKTYEEEELPNMVETLVDTYVIDPTIRSSLDRIKMAQFLRYTSLYLSKHDTENMDKNGIYESIIKECRKDKDLCRKINNEYAMRGIIYGISRAKEEKQKTKE